MRLRVSLVAVVLTACPLFFAACSSSDEGTPTDAGASPGPNEVQTTTPPPDDRPDGSVTDDDGGEPDAAIVPTLPVGAACTSDAQCLSGGCDDTKHCAVGKSCTQLHGGRTCGPNGDQSCCDAIAMTMPKGKVTLDKYNLTAGRMRAFIEKTGGDVRGYVQAHLPAWFDAAWLPWLPNVMDDGTKVLGTDHTFAGTTGRDGVYQQLGPIHYGTEGSGNEGCLTKQNGNARTYRLPDAINTADFNDLQRYGQDVLDEKPLQCVTYFMAAAFCIWDGGRMPTLDEIDFAFDGGAPATHTYPWGTTPVPGGWDNAYPEDPTNLGYGAKRPAGSNKTFANDDYNWWSPTPITCAGNACDYSAYIAPPGRFPKGNGPLGHSDLVGNVYNMAQPATPPAAGTLGDALMVSYTRTGAFDGGNSGHEIPTAHPPTGSRAWLATKKYLAVGARCAR